MDTVIEWFMSEYTAAVREKDVGRFEALYDDDVRVFDAWGEWSFSGRDAWRAMAKGWFDSLGTERVAVEFAEPVVVAGGDLRVLSAFVTYRGLSAEGVELRAMTNRITWALRTRGEAWKIVHEHTSAPADFATTKLILQRPTA
jgi:ketosteroid isomerase-like protein